MTGSVIIIPFFVREFGGISIPPKPFPDTNIFSQLNYNNSLTSLKSTLPHCKIGELLRFICFINTARQISFQQTDQLKTIGSDDN